MFALIVHFLQKILLVFSLMAGMYFAVFFLSLYAILGII